MTISQSEIERKLKQPDNDLMSVYGLLGRIETTQARHGNRLDKLGAKLSDHDACFDTMDSRLERVEDQLGSVDSRLDSVGGQLGQVLDLLRAPRTGD